MKYRLVSRTYYEDLEKEVNLLLQKGWVLYGTPFVTKIHVVQAIIKTDEQIVHGQSQAAV